MLNRRRALILSLLYLCLALFAYYSDSFFQAMHRTGASMKPIPADIGMRVLELANNIRAEQGAPPLAWEDHLAVAADRHSHEMLQLDYFEHESPIPDHRNVWDRVEKTGINPRSVGECLYESAGIPTDEVPQSCIRAWLASPGHRETLMDPKYRLSGVGVGRQGTLYRITMVFSSQ